MKINIHFCLFTVAISFFVLSFCYAQEDTSKVNESNFEGFANVQQMMGPMMEQMMVSMMNSTFEVLSKKENADKLAEFTKNYYDSLINKGFSKEDALKIVISVGIPSIPSFN